MCPQLQYAVQHMLADEEGPERLVVVVDGRGIGTHTEGRSRYVRQAKVLAFALTQVRCHSHSCSLGAYQPCSTESRAPCSFRT